MAAEHEFQADRWGERLPRRIGLFAAIAVLIGSTIGSGIFRTPAVIADRVPSPLPMLGVWVLGGVLALCGALSYAELGAMFPRSGGVFVYIHESFGRLPAFLFGWTELIVIRASALGAISTVFAEYLLRSLGMDPALPQYQWPVHWVAALAIAAMAVLNYTGVRWSAALVTGTTLAKYGALLLLVVVSFALGGHAGGNFGHYVGADGPIEPKLFGLALISVLWAYDGWGDISFVGGEVKNPERTLPLAFILGTLGVVAIYLLVNLAYLYMLPLAAERHSPLVAADVAQLIVGRVGVGLVAVVVMISTLGTLAGSMLTGPRIIYAMAEHRLFFPGLAKVHPRYATPYVSIVLIAILAIGFVLLRTFADLADTFILAILPFYALAALGVFVLRRRRPDAPRPVRVFAYPVPPILFAASAVLILANSLIPGPDNPLLHLGPLAAPRNPLIAFGVILLGLPAYWLWRRRREVGVDNRVS